MQLPELAFAADQQIVAAVQGIALPFDCEKRRVLFHQGDSADCLYILRSGRARLSSVIDESGFEVSFDAAPFSMLGLPGVLGTDPHAFTAIAGAGAQFDFVHRHDLHNLLASDPALALSVLRALATSVITVRSAIFLRIGTLTGPSGIVNHPAPQPPHFRSGGPSASSI